MGAEVYKKRRQLVSARLSSGKWGGAAKREHLIKGGVEASCRCVERRRLANLAAG